MPEPTECEGILWGIAPSSVDLKKAVLRLEKRVAELEKEEKARNTPSDPQPEVSNEPPIDPGEAVAPV